MTFEQIRRAIEAADGAPAEALRSAVAEADALAPLVLAAIEKAVAGVHLTPAQDNVLFHGIHVLAAAQWKGLFQPLVRLLRLPSDRVEDLLGDAIDTSLPGVLISVFDGNAAPLMAAIEDSAIEGTIRCAFMGALARLTFDGAVPRADTIALIDRFERERLAAAGDVALMGWQDMIRLLALADRGELARGPWQDGRASYAGEQDRAEWDELFAAACADPENQQRFIDERLVPIADPAAAIGWLQPNRDKRGRFGQALDLEEIDWLKGFLRSSHMPAEPASFELLDGFLCALAVGPEQVSCDEAIRELCGGDGRPGPRYDSAEQAAVVEALVSRHLTAITARLNAGQLHPPYIAERLDLSNGGHWAIGFMRGMAIRGAAWEPLVGRQPDGQILAPIMALYMAALGEEESDEKSALPPMPAATRKHCIAALPTAVRQVHRYWRTPVGERMAGLPQTRMAGRKVGRNEPCPCGSGKKYKRCCANTAHAAPLR